MIRGIISIVLLASTSVLVADTTVIKTTTTTTNPPAPAAPATVQIIQVPVTQDAPVATQPMTGAYSPIDVNDATVQKAAAFAAANMQKGILVKVESAQVQVVAGTNYKLLLVMNQNNANYQYTVVVFVPLPVNNQPMQLTNVQAMGQVINAQPQ